MGGASRYNAWLLERALPYLGSRVLDVGAGTGTFTAKLLESVESVVAVEPDPVEREALAQRFAGDSRVRVVQLDATRLAKADAGGPFDGAVCFNVLEHIEADVAAISAIRSQLRPGAHLALLVPAHPALFGEIDRTVGHVRRYKRATLRSCLTAGGFYVRELRYVNPVGAAGWLVSSRMLRREHVPEGPLRVYDRFVPILRVFDRIPLPFGLSLWAVAYTPASASAKAAKATE
jgi:SAM-dependent methyltransferase